MFFRLLPLLLALACGDTNHNQAPVCRSDGFCGDDVCGLYLAPSTVRDRLAFYSGIDRPSQSPVGPTELFVSMVDTNKNEYSPWHDIAWDPFLWPLALLENRYFHDLLAGGMAGATPCGGLKRSNMALNTSQVQLEGVHRSTHPTAGSFSYRNNVHLDAIRDIGAGDELFMQCQDEELDAWPGNTQRSVEELQQTGACVDALTVGPSTLPGVGRGAFVKHAVKKDEVITPTLLLYFDRSQLEIVQQQDKPLDQHQIPFERDHSIEYTDQVKGYQLVRNYCYSRPDSNVMLLPVAPAVHFINHADKANAYIRWSKRLGDVDYLKSMPVMELFETPMGMDGDLVMEFVALKDLSPGEEVFIDYGQEWQQAWQKHASEWQKDNSYVSAADYQKKHATKPIRTESEQEKEPYPENLQTACYHYPLDKFTCLQPCRVQERTKNADGSYLYTVVIHGGENLFEPEECHLPDEGMTVSDVPAKNVVLVDKPYTTDEYMHTAFRHEIVLPQDFYPSHWLTTDPEPYGDFIASPLTPGMVAPIRWKGSAQVVAPWAFRVGIPPSVRQVLLEYCNKMGITEILKAATIKGNSLPPGENSFLTLDGESWYLQRPSPDWRSNLHWLSPGDSPAHEDYLQALSVAGFDKVLEGIGEYLGMDGLVAFHVTFIGVSWSTRGYLHHDVIETGAKTYNVIIPLSLANETGPELDVMEGTSEDEIDQDTKRVGRYRYEYNVGSMVGDGAVHATSAVDYRNNKEMRLAATVYVADVNKNNAQNIMAEYTQAYPPRDLDMLLGWAGRHWKKSDPSVKLPKPRQDHILLRSETTASS